MFGRDKSTRFQTSLPSPGPGHYDTRRPKDGGYQSDLRSSFQGSGRFGPDARDEGSGSFASPPRRIPSRSGSRAADWTTERIKDLETKLRISNAKIMELEQVVRESNIDEESKAEMDSELRNAKNKLLEQKAVTAQAQREALRAETERKKLESDQANLEMRIRKAEESRKISESKATEAKYRVTELEKQITKLEDEYDEMVEEYRKEIQALKKRLTAAESSMSKNSRNQDDINSQLATLKQLKNDHEVQISKLEVELGASKAAAESLTAESLAESLVLKAELAVSGERESQKDTLIEQLRAEIAELTSHVEDILQQKEELEAELVTLKAENETKAQTIAELTEAVKKNEEELKARDEIVAELEAKLGTLVEQNKSDKDALKQAQDSVESLTQDLLSKTRDMESLESKMDGITQALGHKVPKEANIEEKLDQISLGITSHHNRVTELEKFRQEQSNQVLELTNKVATIQKEKKAKTNELEIQKKEEKSLRRSLADQEKTMEGLNKQIAETRAKSEKETQTKAKLQTELKALRVQLKEKVAEIAELQRQTESLSQKNASEDSEKDHAITQMQEALKAAQAELANNNTTVLELQQEVEKAGKSVIEKGDEIGVLQAALEEVKVERDALKASLTQLQKNLSEDSQISDLDLELIEVRKDLALAVEAKKRSDELAEGLRNEKANVEEELNQRQEDAKKTQVMISSQSEELSKLTAQKKALEDALEAAQSETDKNSSVASRLATVQRTLQDKEREIRDLKAQIEEVVKGSENSKTSVQKSQARVTKMENELRQKTNSVQELQQEVKALKQANTDLSRERDQASNAAKSKLADKDKRLQRYEREIAVLKDKVGEGAIQPETETVEKLRAEMEKQKRKYESQIRAMQVEPKTFKDMRAEVTASQASLLKSQKQNEALNHELQATRNRLAFYEGEDGHGVELGEVEQLRESLREAQRKVSESQKLAAEYRRQLKQGDTMRLEMERLTAENTYLVSKSAKLDEDVNGLMDSTSSTLGHHNQKQKIQYHLKLKTELEELKKQYTVLARDKFKLEQAIRYLAARADLMSGNPISDISGTGIRHPSAAVAPLSTQESVVLSTPTAKTHMKWASRGRGTTRTMSAYKPRESMERGIEETQVETVIESKALKRDASEEQGEGLDSDQDSGPAGASNLPPLAHMDSVENRILATISSVVHSRKRRVSTME